ncbi:zinc finger protein VAR3, chloroplastic-like [Impatiens glandulifera]|uniref:zinc finger protein VAR3, chloroplastic-like n=1 Tax=Impatiens glandulifera TaxID=253017 RepID=UPI001FB14C0C|nr:zinc finger protein VAR3, chloroplastic-like [Impatiens glandulifera]XP_047338874.1 zinc finger protein VAR3, chloroplastic-like [Impatiens glandulifera]
MSASRLISIFGVSIIRNHVFSSPPLPPIQFRRPLSYPILTFRGYSSASSTSTDTNDNTEGISSLSHPWPEWVAFVDRLKAKGYLSGTPNPVQEEIDEDVEAGGISNRDGNVYVNMHVLKHACMNFARDRFDIFKSLPREDIQTLLEVGCPNLLRKAVNSAKRLRAYVQLDEGDVCGACNLRGSCDRAYTVIEESEGSARTVDLVRILLFYALDKLVISDGEQQPPGRALVESSARNLLENMITLSETPIDPTITKPSLQAPRKKENIGQDKLSADVEMKRGDWMCPKCNFLNFARNVRCLKCHEDGPKQVSVVDGFEMKKGDWMCSECDFVNFARNIKCLKCRAPGPIKVDHPKDVEMKKGDWNCLECGFMNFASNRKCLRCRGSRPKRQLNPGEWECPSCDFLNYKRNTVCLKCNCEPPKSDPTHYEEQLWVRPN